MCFSLWQIPHCGEQTSLKSGSPFTGTWTLGKKNCKILALGRSLGRSQGPLYWSSEQCWTLKQLTVERWRRAEPDCGQGGQPTGQEGIAPLGIWGSGMLPPGFHLSPNHKMLIMQRRHRRGPPGWPGAGTPAQKEILRGMGLIVLLCSGGDGARIL